MQIMNYGRNNGKIDGKHVAYIYSESHLCKTTFMNYIIIYNYTTMFDVLYV